MPGDIYYPDDYYDIVMKLDHAEKERIEKLLKEHHDLKTDYERRYHLQVDNETMGNRKFQEKQKLMRPHDYSKSLDKKLMLEARTSLKKQRDLEQRLKEERERRKDASLEKERLKNAKHANDNIHETRREFREQAKDIKERQFESITDKLRHKVEQKQKAVTATKQQENKPIAKSKETNIDPRRLEFRKEMEEINRQNGKNKEKDLDKEI